MLAMRTEVSGDDGAWHELVISQVDVSQWTSAYTGWLGSGGVPTAYPGIPVVPVESARRDTVKWRSLSSMLILIYNINQDRYNMTVWAWWLVSEVTKPILCDDTMSRCLV